ncbi:type II toxin-antitoxin system RelE/ParE family toxin [Demequina sp. NBRC 110054]|uniref:type II toxin-antitoxin system RelE family toxin n=1 Tax=Demequina sp. NBRC 110054 TaxID=1570343 RepID=UPI000A00C644|nr:hypothetical protein [Demequina sp. NBRC 110054]
MALRISVLPGFEEDLHALPLQAQKAIIAAIVDLREGRRRGLPLEARSSVADLSDCHKLYVGTSPSGRPEYRLVYRLVSNRVTVVGAEIVAAGRREGLDAYLRAARRLGR